MCTVAVPNLRRLHLDVHIQRGHYLRTISIYQMDSKLFRSTLRLRNCELKGRHRIDEMVLGRDLPSIDSVSIPTPTAVNLGPEVSA